MGPRTDPCGTPEFKFIGSEVVPLVAIDADRLSSTRQIIVKPFQSMTS